MVVAYQLIDSQIQLEFLESDEPFSKTFDPIAGFAKKNPAYAKLFSSFLPESAQKWNKVFHQFNWPEHARLFGVIQTIASKKSFFQTFLRL